MFHVAGNLNCLVNFDGSSSTYEEPQTLSVVVPVGHPFEVLINPAIVVMPTGHPCEALNPALRVILIGCQVVTLKPSETVVPTGCPVDTLTQQHK